MASSSSLGTLTWAFSPAVFIEVIWRLAAQDEGKTNDIMVTSWVSLKVQEREEVKYSNAKNAQSFSPT